MPHQRANPSPPIRPARDDGGPITPTPQDRRVGSRDQASALPLSKSDRDVARAVVAALASSPRSMAGNSGNASPFGSRSLNSLWSGRRR